jgi:predicted transcriptional regulator of viral defense system
VEAKAIDLRQHAEHCRRLAKSSIDERTRIILRTMASEFDEQASDKEAGRKTPAPTQKDS